MKKFLCILMLCVMFFSTPLTAFAGIRGDRIGESVIGNILGTLIMDALKKNGMEDILKDKSTETAPEENSESTTTETENTPKVKTSSTNSEEVIELSEAQYQSFSEICLAGSFEEFQKKIEYENISPDAKFTKKDGGFITLLEMAQSSPNKELAAFLKGMNARDEKGVN